MELCNMRSVVVTNELGDNHNIQGQPVVSKTHEMIWREYVNGNKQNSKIIYWGPQRGVVDITDNSGGLPERN